jgi:N-acetylneuraminic acid mutarotase
MTRHRIAGVGLGACLSLAACSTPDSDFTGPAAPSQESLSLAAASNTWTMKRSLSPWRDGMAAGTIDGVIYVVGGERRDRSTALARVDAYTVATNSWTQVAFLPSARFAPNGASMISGKLYVTGGRNSSGNLTRTLYVYDPASNVWTRKTDMPTGGCGGDQGVINGQLYVYTGCYSERTMGAVFFRYNPSTNSWTKRAAPPVDHSSGAGAVINGKFYLAGGFNLVAATSTNSEFEEKTNQLDVYDPATNSWTTKRFMSFSRSGMAAAGLNGKLYLVGGNGFPSEFPLTTVEVYDPATDSWTNQAPLPIGTAFGAAAAAGGKLFYVSGLVYHGTLESQPTVPGPSEVYAYTP